MILNDYEKFIMKSDEGSFMQSLSWAQVKNNWKHETVTVRGRFGSVVAGALLLIKEAPVLPVSFMYIPRGPVWSKGNFESLRRLFEKILEVAKRHNCIFIKADPLIDEMSRESIRQMELLGFDYFPDKVGYDNTQCRENYILPLSGKSAEEIFSAFKPKCRYNIRLAERRGVECRVYGEDNFEDFYTLLALTAERDGFQIRTREYYIRLMKAFGDKARLYMSYKEGVPLSGAIYLEYGRRATYLVGASSNKFRNLMPNYLMQWTMIEDAINDGCTLYDFGGIPYYYDENHRNYGVYRFKQQFSGQVKTYAGEFDYVISPLLYKIAQRFM